MFKPTIRQTQRVISPLFWAGFLSLLLSACVTSSTTSTTMTNNVVGQKERPTGFFDRMVDSITERECNVMKFTCPYGFGPADEPCECVDPKGVVHNGRTVK